MAYDVLATPAAVAQAMTGLQAIGVEPVQVSDAAAALEKIKNIIPAGASVMNGASVTLEQIGFIDYLKSNQHGWHNYHEAIVQESDPIKQQQLRQQAIHADYYLGSVHALAETGEMVIASNTGSQLPHIVFTSPNLILVVGTQKIVPTLAVAMQRLQEYVVPLEDKQMRQKFGMGTMVSKIVIFQHENPMMQRKVHVLLVNEKLGF